MTSFYVKNGYDVEVLLGSLEITTLRTRKDFGLCDNLTVIAASNENRTATFSFIPPESTLVLEDYIGRDVTILIRTPADGWQQVFKGFVDLPQIDFISRKVTLQCSDNRQNKINQLPAAFIGSVGEFSSTVMGTPNDAADELDKRLQTVLADVDFNRFGEAKLTPWAPKSTPDKILSPGDILYTYPPTVTYSNRTKTVNTVHVQVDYNYTRLHHQVVNVLWASFPSFIQWFSEGKPSFPNKETIMGAASASNWRVIGSGYMNFGDVWPAQTYQGADGSSIVWQPNQVTYTYKGRTSLLGYVKDSFGDFVTVGSPPKLVPQFEPVLDANGKQIMDVVTATVTDTSSHLCISAQWTAAIRFVQSVKESFTLTLQAPQSIAKSGVVDTYSRTSYDDLYDASQWEGSDTINYINYNFYIDQKNNLPELKKAIYVSLKKAQHDIIAAHRDTLVDFTTVDLKPTIDITDTIDVTIDQSAIGSTALIHAKARTNIIQHTINLNTLEANTRVTLKLSHALGSVANDNWTINATMQNPGYINTTVNSITLGTHIGVDPAVAYDGASWNGWICNSNQTINGTPVRTNFQETFIVDYPSIPDTLRNLVTYPSEQSFNMALPSDILEISF